MLRIPMFLYSPMRLLRIPEPLAHPEFLFEPKIDGLRALAYIDGSECRLISGNGHVLQVVARADGGCRNGDAVPFKADQ
jgi:ATP-dependent DNA ligase